MKEKLKTHIGLGRFFGAPVVLGAVLLGIALGGHWSWLSVMIVLASVLEMAYAHSFNTLLDYSWTGLDKGTEEERSKGKVYTKGQQAIAAGMLSSRGVLINGLVYLFISAILTGIVAWHTSYVIWIIWALAALCTFWYSWGKLHYQCELALGVGFGPLAVMLGMASQPNPDFLLAFLAGIPILFVWGYGAETLDQWTDAEPNWPRGLRNFGALLWKNQISVTAFIAWMVVMTFVSQIFMILGGILHPFTAITLITFIPFSFMLLYLEKDLKVGVYWGLVGGIFLYCILLPVGQVLGTLFW
jgi:1,4-dihydroxy-2-naphthoate octaprenyltransferase